MKAVWELMYHNPATDSIYILVRQYLAIFAAHIWAVAVIVLVALVIGITSTVTSPDEYTSSTTVNFDLKNTNPFAGAGVVDGGFIATQVDLIGSKTVAQRVVDGLGEDDLERVKYSIWNDYTLLDSIMAWFHEKIAALIERLAPEEEVQAVAGNESPDASATAQRENPVTYSWMASAISARLKVKPVIGSTNIALEYVSTDPYVAALIVNGVASEFADYSVERGTKPAERTKAWLDQQLETLRDRLEQAQTRLTTFQQETGIVASSEKLDLEEVKLQQLTTQLGEQRKQTKEVESRWQQIKASAGNTEALSTIPQIINAPAIQNIKSEIRGLEGQLTEVSSKFGENHPQYKTVVAELSDARSKFNREIRAVASSAEKEAKLARQTEENLAKVMEEQKALVLKLKNQMDEISVLEREIDSNRETYNAALAQYNQSNLQSLVSQANVSVVDYAVPSRAPSGPSLVKNTLASLVLGFILAIGIVFLKEFFSRKIRCREDVFIDEHSHLLGVIGR